MNVLPIVILAVLLLMLFLRVGISAEYGADGVVVTARIGWLSLRIYPKPVRPEKPVKKKRKAKKEKKPAAPTGKRGGDFGQFKAWLEVILNLLTQIRKRLTINELTLVYTAASGDAAAAALQYGRACAVVAALVPVMERGFKIRRRDIQVLVDFEAPRPVVYVKGRVSMAIWEVLRIAVAFGYAVVKKGLLKKQKGGS